MYKETYIGKGLITKYVCMGRTWAIQIDVIDSANENCEDSYSLSPYNNMERTYDSKIGDKVELYYCSSGSGGSIMFKLLEKG